MHVLRHVTKSDLPAVVDLILRVFDANVAETFSAEGVEVFREATPRENEKGYEAGHIFLAAERGGVLVGVLRMKNNGYLYSLFVNPPDQGQGIGRALLLAGIEELRKRQPQIECITLKSAPNAIDVYKGWGFVQSGEEIEREGIRAVPMELRIDCLG